MKSKFIYLISTILLLSVAVSSCNKDEDEESTSLYLTGTVSFSMPIYVHEGDTLHLSHSWVTKEDGSKQVGYYWTVTAFGIKDTTRLENTSLDVAGDFTFVVPDTLTNFTVSCVAFASGYYNSSGSKSAAIVDTVLFTNTGSITGLRRTLQDITIVDPRDNRTYYAIKSDTLDWFRQNINYTGCGVPFMDYKELSAMFGRYYTWSDAQKACPEGWRLPSDKDFASLARAAGAVNPEVGKTYENIAGNLMVDAYFNGNKLWEFWPQVPITDNTHFSAMPFGYGVKTMKSFDFFDLYYYAIWWTADSFDEERGLARYINPEDNDLMCGAFNKEETVLPVRCVRADK